MLARIRSGLTYANVMATLAVFVALGGGAYAAVTLPANSVGAKQLKKGAVTPAKVASRTVRLFKGQRGDQGPTGPQGRPGQSGPAGIQGAAGATGPVGPSNAYFNFSTNTQTSVSVPAGDYAVNGQCNVSGSVAATPATVALQVNGGGIGTAVGVTVPASGEAEGSVQNVAHLAAPGSITSICIVGAGNSIMGNTITASKVGVASP